MGIDARLKQTWIRLSDRYAGSPTYWLLSPTYWTLRKNLVPVIEKHAAGRILDAGAGRLAHKDLLEKAGRSYAAVDVAPHGESVQQGDLLDLPFEDGSFETVFCSQVLEHVKDPERAAAEMLRVLVPGGRLILSAPHLAYLHNEPHDYWRFTSYGLRALVERAGGSVILLESSGGLIAYLSHIPITLWLGMVGTLPVLGPLFVWEITWETRLYSWLDHLFGMKRRFALNHILVVEKKGRPEA